MGTQSTWEARSRSPKNKSRSRSPRRKSKSRSPKDKSRSRSPKAKPRSLSPKGKAGSRSPSNSPNSGSRSRSKSKSRSKSRSRSPEDAQMTKTESNHGDASQDDTTRNEDIEMAELPENQDNNCATSEAVNFHDNSVEGEENESSNKSD